MPKAKINPVKNFTRIGISKNRSVSKISNGVKIPSKMKWLFWSYDIGSLDLKDDKDYIITQILNYGTWEDLKWLYKAYSEKEIKALFKKPIRGVWFEKVLNFWTTIFEIKLPKKVWDKAVMNIHPVRKP